MRLRLFVCASLASAILGTGFDDVNGEARTAHSELTGSANLIPLDWPEAQLVSIGDSVTSESYVRGAQLSVTHKRALLASCLRCGTKNVLLGKGQAIVVEFEPKPDGESGSSDARGRPRGELRDSR